MDINCGKRISTELSGVGAFQLSLTQDTHYRRDTNCRMLVQARPGHKLMFYFASFDIKYYSYVRGGYRYSGCIDYIDIRDGNSRQSPFIKGFTSGICGISRGPDHQIYNSTGQYVTVYFYSTPDGWSTGNNGFTLVFTEYHTGNCSSNEFRCPHTGKCIQDSVTCNRHNPCGDHSDCPGQYNTHRPGHETQQSSPATDSGLDVPTVIGIVIAVGFLIILVILVVAVVKSRRYHSRRRRCRHRQRDTISFIDVGSTTPGQPPSYEEVCGGIIGPYDAMAPPPYAEEDPNKHMETSIDGAPRETQTNAPQSREIYPNISHAGQSQPSTSQIGQIQPHTCQRNEMSPYTSENEQSQLNISQSREICINTSQAGAAQSDASQGEVTQTITSQLGGQEPNTCQREDTQFSRFQRNQADWSR